MHRNDQNRSAGKSVKSNGMLTCSSCGRPFHIDQTPTPPFCSERCQLIDLGRWLGEEISVPHEGGNSASPGAAAENEE